LAKADTRIAGRYASKAARDDAQDLTEGQQTAKVVHIEPTIEAFQ